jgi:HSP20 family molecular chaperone IbpA
MTTDLTKQDPKAAQSEMVQVERTHGGTTYSPPIDIWESDEELVLYADMPGVVAQDLEIQFENRELRIHGRVQPRQQNVHYLYGEYGIGDYFRTFTVGETIDTDGITAELEHGVLTLHLPKTAAVKPRRIAVQAK